MAEYLKELVERANAPLDNPDMNGTVGNGPVRFELYHFAFSLCSQKVRLCLAEKSAAYISHDINLSMPHLGNYDPDYVRLRLEAKGSAPLASGYTGRSSVQSEGFDPAVVPTLVDHDGQVVVADSLAICRYIDRVVDPNNALIPEDLAGDVARELAIVDGTPHVALLYGAHPEIDFRPERIRNGMDGVHERKIAKIRVARAQSEGDLALIDAFDAKIAKEIAAQSFVASADQMQGAVDEILGIVADLDTRLASGQTWICGDRLTLADLLWAVSLFRLKWMGAEFAWSGDHKLNDIPRPSVQSYAERLFALPTFRSSIIDWPEIIRSEYVADHYDD
jgi:2,5-dichlorohydroquinone reductive dechlorinase